MKERILKSTKVVTYNGKSYTIMVLGALNETNEINGFYVVPVTFNGKTNKVRSIEYDRRTNVPGFGEKFTRTKTFNMGWAICNQDDVFDEAIGEEICRRRFSKSPMKTQNGRFLTKDMCQAIVENEVKYIADNLPMFLPKTDENIYDMCFKFDKFGKTENKDIEFIVESDGNFTFENVESEVEKIVKDIMSEKNVTNNVNNNQQYQAPGDMGAYEPHKGNYVKWYCNGRQYLGIINWVSESEGVCEEQRSHFYFCAPINENNGLIDHDKSLLFGDIRTPLNNRFKFMPVTDNERRLIDDYLKGALRMKWDADKMNFVVCVDYGL